jgi:AcrR family transcriptional regulator
VPHPHLTSQLRADDKGTRTRARIVHTALELFRAHGYEKTTMARIAEEAGVSKGNAYYYFRSKEELVQAFYDELQHLHLQVVKKQLPLHETLEQRLLVVMESFVEVARPYHAFADKFFQVAANPHSPLSPFSKASTPARTASMALFKEALVDAEIALDDTARAELPTLLWLAHMGVVLFWVHDHSPHQRKTLLLVQRAVPLLARAIRLGQSPLLRPLRDQVLALVRDLQTLQK